MVSGFEACGIYPLNPMKFLQKLPNNGATVPSELDETSTSVTSVGSSSALNNTVLTFLKNMRHDKVARAPSKRKIVNIEPGKSILVESSESEEGEEYFNLVPPLICTISKLSVFSFRIG